MQSIVDNLLIHVFNLKLKIKKQNLFLGFIRKIKFVSNCFKN